MHLLWQKHPLSASPCAQVFDNTPAALDGTMAAGDEITGVNGKSIKGKTKVEVAKMIQEVKVRVVGPSAACLCPVLTPPLVLPSEGPFLPL